MCKKDDRRKKLLRNRLRHNLHPFQIYCRMRDAGLQEDKSVKRVCILYERCVWAWLKELIQKLPDKKGGV